jgi:hypothetical protein
MTYEQLDLVLTLKNWLMISKREYVQGEGEKLTTSAWQAFSKFAGPLVKKGEELQALSGNKTASEQLAVEKYNEAISIFRQHFSPLADPPEFDSFKISITAMQMIIYLHEQG